MENENNKITWGSIIPLIGGLSIAASNTFGNNPDFIVSWNVFQHNDKHYVNYLRTKKNWSGKYYVLDYNEKNVVPDVTSECSNLPYADVICGCPPCAGLSSFSTTSSADSAVNDHMINAAHLVLETIKPKVYIFENAPRLSSEKGRPVADKLYKIASDNGYSLMLYSTESRLHGNCQIRPRTFGFFLKKSVFGDKCLHVMNIDERSGNYIDFIKDALTSENDPMRIVINKDIPSESPFYKYCFEYIHAENHEDFVNKMCITQKSVNLLECAIKFANNDYVKLSEWMKEHGFDKIAEKMLYMKSKIDDGKGCWTHGITLGKYIIPAYIGVMPMSMVHPHEDRYINIRESMTLMGMPKDFELCGNKPHSDYNHVCQNVPVGTAEDMFKQIKYWFEHTENNENMQLDSDYVVNQHKKHDFVINLKPKDETSSDIKTFF